MTELSLDYETFSEIDIVKQGGGKYVRDPSTEILMLGWAFDDDPVQLWEPHLGPMPNELREGMEDPHVEKWAFNAAFEDGITKYQSDIKVPKWTWRCTQFLAYGLSFSGGLDSILKQVGFPEHLWKNADGKKLIRKFSVPQPRNQKVRRWTYGTAPEMWEDFCGYCKQDVEVERALRKWVKQFDPISDDEWQTWLMDQDINNAGIPIDRILISTARASVTVRKNQIIDRMRQVTGLDNPGSRAQLQPWLQERTRVPLSNMQANTLEWAQARVEDPVLEGVIQDMLWVSQTATAKWDAFDRMECDDHTLKGMFMPGGASRTRRYASRGINLQNLKRPLKGVDMDTVCQAIKDLSLAQLYPDYEVMDLLAASVRGAIAAPEGKKLAVSDLGSIESRVLGWMSGCTRIINTFAAGKDTYKDFAMELFQVLYDEVTKDQRGFSKPPTLGCGYQLGAGGLVAYAEDMGVSMSRAEADRAVSTFRRVYPEIPAMWRWLIEAITYVVQGGGTMSGYRVHIYRDLEFLYIQLPSGRRLAYHKPEIQPREIHWVDADGVPQSMVKPSFTYMGINRFNMQWERISTHGGGVTENIVQAISRDILVYQMRLSMNRGHDVRGHVHDEIITVCPDQNAEAWLESLRGLMCISPPWAQDLLLGAEGYTAKHYRKD